MASMAAISQLISGNEAAINNENNNSENWRSHQAAAKIENGINGGEYGVMAKSNVNGS
jgi:hypothetical protein